MKVLAGYTVRTSGTILLNGRPAEYDHPSQAARLGIGMLYQDPLDFPPLTVLENFMMDLAVDSFQEKKPFVSVSGKWPILSVFISSPMQPYSASRWESGSNSNWSGSLPWVWKC